MNDPNAYFNLHPINFLIVSGVIQGFILASILFFNKRATKLLALAIIIVNFHLSFLMILDLNLDNIYPFILWIPYSYLTGLGPVIYFYTKTLVNPKFKINRKDWLHFLPVFIEFITQIIQISYSVINDVLVYNVPYNLPINIFIYAFVIGSLYYYLKLSIKEIRHYEQHILSYYANLKNVTLAWLSKLIGHFRLIWMLWMPFAIIFLLVFRFQIQLLSLFILIYALLLAITYLTYWIGIEGLLRTKTNADELEMVTSKPGSYAHLSGDEVNRLVRKIQSLMIDDKLFLNENLNLKSFALSVKADPNLVSHILNKHLDNNFYEFINRYRVEELKSKLSDPANRHLTLLALAFQSGFNSKTTFNRIFKQMTGVTPSQYVKAIKKP